MSYCLADQIALEIIRTCTVDQSPRREHAFHAALDLHAALTTFIESAFLAYCSLRGIPKTRLRTEEADDV